MSSAVEDRQIECIIPILSVKNMQASLEFYRDVLGFMLDWMVPTGQVASVSRDACSIMLCQGEQGHPGTWVWVGVEDVEKLYEEFCSSGATILQPLTDYPWAREMRVEDPDGHVLRFGGAPRASEAAKHAANSGS